MGTLIFFSLTITVASALAYLYTLIEDRNMQSPDERKPND